MNLINVIILRPLSHVLCWAGMLLICFSNCPNDMQRRARHLSILKAHKFGDAVKHTLGLRQLS